MIRIQTEDGWILIRHPDHAVLAGRIAAHWGNEEFPRPEPLGDVLVAVERHDDAWGARDAAPFLTRLGLPSAFSRELVGAYSAFEEIDIRDYLAVRGRAAEGVAADNPYAAVLISMHTVDLLTNRADWTALGAGDRELLRTFVEHQRTRQTAWVGGLLGEEGRSAADAAERLSRNFEFLQFCDSLSLTACVRYPKPIALRHSHRRRDGTLAGILCTPLGGDTYRVSPYPFDRDELEFETPARPVAGASFPDVQALRASFAAAPVIPLNVRIVR